MNNPYLSRRHLLGAFAATTAGVLASSLVLNPTAAYADDPPADPDILGLPDTDRGQVVKAWMTGGPAVKAAAEAAVTGSDSDVQAFLAGGLATAAAADNRAAVITVMAKAAPRMSSAAATALDGDDDAVLAFLQGGFQAAYNTDLSITTANLIAAGGKRVAAAGSAALDAGTQDALEAFVGNGQFTAALLDMQIQTANLSVGAGPEVRTYASRALDGTATDIEWFLDTGQFIARARDQEAVEIGELVAVVQREAERAANQTQQAEDASARAVQAADKAKAAAATAAAEAAAAANDVTKAGNAARKAAQAASGAADAARVAISASAAAIDASRRASRAAMSASHAASVAGSAAANAYNCAVAASKDASKAAAAKAAATACRTAAAGARTTASAAEKAAGIADRAAAAGKSAATAANQAASAASASAQAASSASGVAQAEAAEAARQAQIASSNAAIATDAAAKAQSFANQAASAARAARDAANDAADHADAAADAADWAAQYAGKAIDYANKSTAFANAATTAANNALAAVTQAAAVEAAARQAEWDRLAQDQTQAMKDCRQIALLDTVQGAVLRVQRTQDQRTAAATLDLISQAEAALAADNLDQATAVGRKAAVAVMNSGAAWSREAARFALAGADTDVHTWIGADRALAKDQDDRETVLAIAQAGSADVCNAVVTVLGSDQAGAAATFLDTGIKDATRTGNQIGIARILAAGPGRLVKQAANDALDANTAQAAFDFFQTALPAAQMQDDAVATANLLGSAGPYTKAYAQAAMEGPAWMRRHFLSTVQYTSAQLDYDSATHIAAMQGAIFAATKLAHTALQNACLAQEAAANARKAAADAQKYKDQAAKSAGDAAAAAVQANTLADAAEQSAQDAQASANQAASAATSARTASRMANYSANNAAASARSAVSSATSAQASAVSARASAVQAGKDAAAAAQAASDAHKSAREKRQKEIEAAALQRAVDATNQKNPIDTPDNDNRDDDDIPKWQEDARKLAEACEANSATASSMAGIIALEGVFFAEVPEAAAVFETVAGAASLVSIGLDVTAVVAAYFGWGPDSPEFRKVVGSSTFAMITFGAGKYLKTLDEALDLPGLNSAKSVIKIADGTIELGSGIVRGIGSWFS
ncbi:ALF repeat-containing protein [Streptomyces sp. CA-111067]|uniref:ALF repeat-containing protein n=1 Tax=Streptomyces sp. CA-111067 TaxID=3240046 RepID=UPI003D952AAA